MALSFPALVWAGGGGGRRFKENSPNGIVCSRFIPEESKCFSSRIRVSRLGSLASSFTAEKASQLEHSDVPFSELHFVRPLLIGLWFQLFHYCSYHPPTYPTKDEDGSSNNRPELKEMVLAINYM